ncbi:MAG: DNA alkylation repair protein [Clostridia bacterium]|nr:DNA alkylation repair protein [Clostridia bacterium]
MPYRLLMEELENLADPKYRDFQMGLIKNPDVRMMGVRTPDLRRIAKRYKTEEDWAELLEYPDEIYEIRFITLAVIAEWPYDLFQKGLIYALELIDNWALCDSFVPKSLKDQQGDFLLTLINLITSGKEFYERFACVMMLKYYINDEYISTVFALSECAHTGLKNVQTGVAWLLSECAVRFYDRTKEYFETSKLDEKTYSLAIRKCCESLRLTAEQKTELKDIKKKWLSVKKSEKSST